MNMNFKSFLRGLARAFTVPASVRKQVDNSVLGQVGKAALLSELSIVRIVGSSPSILQATGIAPKG